MKAKIIIDALRSHRELEALWKVGPESSKGVKRDFLVIFSSGDINSHSLQIIDSLSRRAPGIICKVYDDAVRFLLEGEVGGLAVIDRTTLHTRLANPSAETKFIWGERRAWATGYWLPEAFFGDLAQGESLINRKGWKKKIRSFVDPYPPELSRSIIQQCKEEISVKLERAQGEDLGAAIARSDVASCLIRLAFAKNKIYLRGFKSIEMQARGLSRNNAAILHLAEKLMVQTSMQAAVTEIKSSLFVL